MQVPSVNAEKNRLQSFTALVEEYGPALQRLIFGYEASAEDRRDLYQEILVALWLALPSFEERASLKTWLFRIAHNVAASHSLRALRRNRISRRTVDELVERPTSTDGESAAESHILVEELACVVRALRPMDRQIVLLFLEGLKTSEISDVTGLSETNVTTRVSRLRATLRDQFQERHRND
jgi:RNA polymerase sigma-70 factor (ECF subfamily)